MITINKISKNKYMFADTTTGFAYELNYQSNPVINKIDTIIEFVQKCSEVIGESFDMWYAGMMKEYSENAFDQDILIRNIPQLKSFVDKFFELQVTDYSQFVNNAKRSSKSIFFDENDNSTIIRGSHYLKLYYLIREDVKMATTSDVHKNIFRALLTVMSNDTRHKIFSVIVAKLNSTRSTDSYMWKFIRDACCKTNDMYTIHINNWIMNNIMVTMNREKNPISYLTSVINESLHWVLYNVYKDNIMWMEQVTTEDTTSMFGKDRVTFFAYNDTLARIIYHGLTILQKKNADLTKLEDRIGKSTYIPSVARSITFPIISRIFNINYNHLGTIQSKNTYYLNVLVHGFLTPEFITEFPIVSRLLLAYPCSEEIQKTNYQITSYSVFDEEFVHFNGSTNSGQFVEAISGTIGKILRNTYYSLIDDRKIAINKQKLEVEIIKIYCRMFAGKFDAMFAEIRKNIQAAIMNSGIGQD